MVGREVRCAKGYSFDSTGNQLDEAYSTIQLQEPREIGEIINEYKLILNNSMFGDVKTKHNTGDYVSVIDIRYLSLFETDIDYSDRKDLKKIKNSEIRYQLDGKTKTVTTNIYAYCGTNFPQGYKFN